MKSTCRTWVSTRRKSSLLLKKKCLGIYISGHPLEEYEDHVAEKHFCRDQQISSWMRRLDTRAMVEDESRQIIGGMITAKTIKYTKTE